MQAEQDRRDAVCEPDGDDAERAARVECEPHQRDVVQRVAELAGLTARKSRRKSGRRSSASVAPRPGAGSSSSRGMSKTGSDTAKEYLVDGAGTTLEAVTATRALTGDDLSLDDVWAVAVERRPAAPLSEAACDQMRAARAVVEAVAHGAHEHTYGVNTGFGRFVSKSIPEEQTEELQLRLLRSHACGVGEPYPDSVVRAAMLLRANALAKGNSGARVETVELLLECLNRGVLPFVPARGSVGASGDLAPLAHLALPLVGEGRAWWKGELVDGSDALAHAGLEPVRLVAKEGLSLINGTQFMAAQGALALVRARRLARVADCVCALSLEALQGSRNSFIPQVQALRPLRGQAALGQKCIATTRGLRDQRVPPLVRQGSGRVLASLRAAGARCFA